MLNLLQRQECNASYSETGSGLNPVLMFQVVQLLKAGKGKEVSYNALATHIIAEDGDNPEVGESREVFDLPVVKVRAPCFHLTPQSSAVCL